VQQSLAALAAEAHAARVGAQSAAASLDAGHDGALEIAAAALRAKQAARIALAIAHQLHGPSASPPSTRSLAIPHD
jgi:alkylation response protein AidB-like acyl-CoA dehydrogenase